MIFVCLSLFPLVSDRDVYCVCYYLRFSRLYHESSLDLVLRQNELAQSKQRGLKRHRDVDDDEMDVEEEGRKLIALSNRKLKQREGGSKSNLRQTLLINSVIEQCGKRRRENRAVYARSHDVSKRINERPKRIPFVDITNIIKCI